MKVKISLKQGWFSKLLALYVIIWAVLPIVQYGLVNRLLVAAAALIWFAIAIGSSIVRGGGVSLKIFAAVITFTLLTIFIGVICNEGLFETFISRLQSIIFLLILCIGVYYFEKEPDFLITAMKIVVPIVFVVAFLTFREAQLTPGISRLMVWDEEVARQYASKGVGGYGLIYSAVFYASCLLYLFAANAVRRKFWVALVIIMFALTVLTSGFLIASIMMITSLFVFFFGLYTKKDRLRVIGSILIIGVAAYFLIQIVFINNGDKLVELFDGTLYETKMREIVLMFQEEQNVGHLQGRTSRYLESIYAVLKYPFLGAKISGDIEGVGGHSMLLDIWGTYGLMFSFGYYYAMYKAFRIMTKNKAEIGLVSVFMVLLLANGCFNTFAYEHAVAFFIIFPATILLRIKKREEENENYMDNPLGNA